MKHTILSIIAILSVFAFSSCRIETAKEYEKRVTYSVNAKDFNNITANYPCDITYIPSDTFSVVVKAPEKLRPRLKVSVEQGTLSISEIEDSTYINMFDKVLGHLEIEVKAPVLTSVIINGEGNFACNSTMRTPQLNLAINGSGDIKVKDIQAEAVVVGIHGAGDVNAGLTNVANTAVQIAGSGDIDMAFHHCGDVTAAISGSGDIDLQGDVRSFNHTITGSGDINTDKLTITK